MEYDLLSRKRKIQLSLLGWAADHLRSFPWRKSTSPYEIIIAEVLLKRTTAKAAARIYEQFLIKYPSISSLSKARREDLESILKPIGYNLLRAKELYLISTFILENFGGKIPTERQDLLEIPFIGEYTAGAVLCFGFDSCSPMADSNVERIIYRIFARSFKKKPSNKKVIGVVSRIIPEQAFKQFNLALLDLGALVCLPKNPRCGLCPLLETCDFGHVSQIKT
jgi:A/G-specific adenine glycosylase